MRNLLTRPTQQAAGPAAATTPEARRRILAALATEEAHAPDRLARLATRVTEARERETQARQALEAASRGRAQLEGEQLIESTATERRVALLRRQLADGAPADLERLCQDVRALADHARSKVTTWLGVGFETTEGRRPTTVATNAEEIRVFLEAARQVLDQVEAVRYTEAPDLEALAPFAQVTIAGGVFERSPRHDEPPMLVARVAIVPASLAEQFSALGGVSSPTPLLSPAELRQTAWDAARSAERRWSGEPWR